MESFLIAIIGIFGAVIGASASIVTTYIQNYFQAKRERTRLIMEIAFDDRKSQIELARSLGRAATIPPVALYLHYHLELLKLIEKGSMKQEDLEKLTRENREINNIIKRLQKEEQKQSNDN